MKAATYLLCIMLRVEWTVLWHEEAELRWRHGTNGRGADSSLPPRNVCQQFVTLRRLLRAVLSWPIHALNLLPFHERHVKRISEPEKRFVDGEAARYLRRQQRARRSNNPGSVLFRPEARHLIVNGYFWKGLAREWPSATGMSYESHNFARWKLITLRAGDERRYVTQDNASSSPKLR